MGTKREKKIGRMEAAQELARLSGQVADGFLELAGNRAELPEEILLKRSLKIKKNEISFEFTLKIKAERDSKKAQQRQRRSSSRSSEKSDKRPYKAKKLKKEIGMMWKALKRCIKSGETFRDKDGFIRALNTYGQSADREWAREWERCESLVKEALELAGKGNVDEALERCKKVDEMTKACHKKYK